MPRPGMGNIYEEERVRQNELPGGLAITRGSAPKYLLQKRNSFVTFAILLKHYCQALFCDHSCLSVFFVPDNDGGCYAVMYYASTHAQSMVRTAQSGLPRPRVLTPRLLHIDLRRSGKDTGLLCMYYACMVSVCFVSNITSSHEYPCQI